MHPSSLKSKNSFQRTLLIPTAPPPFPQEEGHANPTENKGKRRPRSKAFTAAVAVLLFAIGASSLLYTASALPNSTITEVNFIVVTSGAASSGTTDNASSSTVSRSVFTASVSIQYRAGAPIDVGPLPFEHTGVAIRITSIETATPGFGIVSTSPNLPIQIAKGGIVSIILVIQTPTTSYSGPLSLVIFSIV